MQKGRIVQILEKIMGLFSIHWKEEQGIRDSEVELFPQNRGRVKVGLF
jgi:hypothetical protein